MPEPITKPNFPPAPSPETHYPFLATVGISRARLRDTCIKEVEVVGISSIDLNTVKVRFNGGVQEGIPVWIHTDYGTRRREIRGEEAVDPADYFERAALIFPLPGAKAFALVEGETSVLGIVSVKSNLDWRWFAGTEGRETKPAPPFIPPVGSWPTLGCWPTWKLYLDIEIYCNDFVHVSKNEQPSNDRGYTRLIYDMHDDKVASILNSSLTGFVDAEYEFVDADNPTATERAQQDVVEAFLARGERISTPYPSNIFKKEYTKNTGLPRKPDPCVGPAWMNSPLAGAHYDLDGAVHPQVWVQTSPTSYEIDGSISAPFSPGSFYVEYSGEYNNIRKATCSMNAYAGATKHSIYPDDAGNTQQPVGLGIEALGWWIMNQDCTFAEPSERSMPSFIVYSPVLESSPDHHPAAYRPNQFCEHREYITDEETGGVDIIFDAYNDNINYSRTTTAYYNYAGVPDGTSRNEGALSDIWNFKVTMPNITPNPVIYEFSYIINEEHNIFYDTTGVKTGFSDVTIATLTPPYMDRVTGYNYIHNTLFCSQGIGIATLRDSYPNGERDHPSRTVSVISRDNDVFYRFMDFSPGDSSLPTPAIDLSAIISSYKNRLAASNNEGWWIYPDIAVGHGYPNSLLYQAGHIHIACTSWLVPYDLREALLP